MTETVARPTRALDNAPIPPLRTRKPTGEPPWPRILLSGEQGARKSWLAAELSADQRINLMYWLEIGTGETTADEYGKIPGAKYEIVEHDGTWSDIIGQLRAAFAQAVAAEGRGEVHALTVDAMSGIRAMLMDMADTRARRKLAAQLRDKRQNPDLAWSSERDVAITPDLFNLVKKRQRDFMHYVLNWPGPVVMTSRENLVTVFDAGGNPTKEKDWSLECAKELRNECTGWVRLTNTGSPYVVKLRSVKAGLMPDHPIVGTTRDDFTCATLIFEWIGCVAGKSRAPKTTTLDADQVMPGEQAPPEPDDEPTRPAKRARSGQADKVAQFRDQVLAASSTADLAKVRDAALAANLTGKEQVQDTAGTAMTLARLITVTGEALKAAEVTTPPGPAGEASLIISPEQLAVIQKDLRAFGADTKTKQLIVATVMLGRRVTSMNALTSDESEVLALTLGMDTAREDVAEALAGPSAQRAA